MASRGEVLARLKDSLTIGAGRERPAMPQLTSLLALTGLAGLALLELVLRSFG